MALLEDEVVLVNGGRQGVGAGIVRVPCARARPSRSRAAERLPMGKLGQVDEIADFVVLLLSDRGGVVTGSVIDWDQKVMGASD